MGRIAVAQNQIPDEDEDALIELMASFENDPIGFVYAAFPWGEGELKDYDGPDDWALIVLGWISEGLIDMETAIRIAVASGHGIGKSALLAWIILWALSTREGTKGVITANTETQLRTKTWPEIVKWYHLLICKHWFVCEATSIKAADPAKEETWRFDRVTWSQNNTQAFAGLHNNGKRLVIIFDEASSIIDAVWEVTKGALSDGKTQIIWLAFGNPTENSGEFWACFHGKIRKQWRTLRVDSRTVKITNKKFIAEEISIWGLNSDYIKRRWLGIFPSGSVSQFIKLDDVRAAMEREVTWYATDPIILGVDVARFGDDHSAIYTRRGREFAYRPPIRIYGQSTMVLVAKIAELYNELKPDAIFIDGGGIGGPVCDRLTELQIPHIPINNEKPATDRKWSNLGTQCWGNLRDLLPDIHLPDDETLQTDLTTRLYDYDRHNAQRLESKRAMKDRGVASPDDADAAALCCAFPVGPRDPRKDRGLDYVVEAERGRNKVSTDYNPIY